MSIQDRLRTRQCGEASLAAPSMVILISHWKTFFKFTFVFVSLKIDQITEASVQIGETRSVSFYYRLSNKNQRKKEFRS